MLASRNWYQQVIIWGLYFGLLFFLLQGRFTTSVALKSAGILGSLHLVIAYVNIDFLIPKYYQRKQYITYVTLCVILIFGIALLIQYLSKEYIQPYHQDFPFKRLKPNREFRFFVPFLPHVFPSLIVLLFSSLYKISKLNTERESETTLLRSENLASELNFLRSQINPHFLFNAMNNLYALSEAKSNQTSEMILKLSEMLRYNLYDADRPNTKISQEINYIYNYINFFKIKVEYPNNISLTTGVKNDYDIAPMLLIPFIENAFKHSKIENDITAKIDIEVSSTDHKIVFSITNTIPTNPHHKDSVGGIGVQNVRRRLEILYKDRHDLLIEQRDDLFKVNLTILT